MNLTIFSKQRTSGDGRKFTSYLTRLIKKTGEVDVVAVKFREECGAPQECPCNIIVDRDHVNLSERYYTDEDTGEQMVSKALWVSKWTQGEAYVDHSLDDYEID